MSCLVCERPVADGGPLHPECFAARAPADALLVLAGVLFTALAPVIVLWAG